MQTNVRASNVRLALSILVLGLFAHASWCQAPAHPKKPAAASAATDQPANEGLTARGGQRAKFTPEQESSFEAETKEAVLVAPNYRDSGLAPLRFTYNDAAELKAELERQHYKVHLVPSTEATSDGVRDALNREKTYLDGTTQGTLIFAFMGHGFEDSKGKNYLMTYGADPSNMDKEALSVDEVEELMKASGARRKVIFIDACRSAAGARGGEKPRSMADFKASEGMSVLLATRPGAYSYEDPELSHGVFTYFVLEGMRGKAAGKDGFISFGDLSHYVLEHVSEYAEKKDQAQKPRIDMKDVGGDFLMATAPPLKAEEVKPPSPVDSQITSDTPVMKALGTGQSFFVILSGNNLTLINASNGQPYAMLTEDPAQLKNQDEVTKRSLRWFGGDAPEGKTINMVAESHGNDLVQFWGRVGKPCPGNTACSQTPYPLLPGETRSTASTTNKTANKAANTLRDTFSTFNRHGTAASTAAANATGSADRNGLVADARDKFVWSNFDLTSTLKVAQNATAPPQHP